MVFPLEKCEVSIIVVLYNQAHLGLLCLESILQNAKVSYQLILVDNNSTDNTHELLERLDGVEVIRNKENLGFGHAYAPRGRACWGNYLCFLNNDALLGRSSLSAVLRDCREDQEFSVL